MPNYTLEIKKLGNLEIVGFLTHHLDIGMGNQCLENQTGA